MTTSDGVDINVTNGIYDMGNVVTDGVGDYILTPLAGW